MVGEVAPPGDRHHGIAGVVQHERGHVDHREHLPDVDGQVVAHQLRGHARCARAPLVPGETRRVDRPRLALQEEADHVAGAPSGLDRRRERLTVGCGQTVVILVLEDPGEGPEQRQRRHPLGVGRREHDRHRTTLGHPVERGPLEPRGVHDRADVVHPILDAAEADGAVREPRSPLVEHDHPRVLTTILELLRDRQVPHQVQVRHEPGHDDDVDARAVLAVRDREVAALRVLHLGSEHYRPFQTGVRFSAKAATPSAASSDCVCTVSIPWR